MQTHSYNFGAVYAPVQSERALRREFLVDLGTILRKLPRQHLLITDDWNGHLGKDSAHCGLQTPTTAGGHDVLLFIELRACLTNLDHNFLIRNRGAWRHSVAHGLNELDYFIGSLDMRRMAAHFRVQPYPFSDHLAKVGCFHLATGTGKVWRRVRVLTAQRYSAEPKLDLEAIQGPSTEAQNLRIQLRNNIDRTLQPLLPNVHLHPSSNDVGVHILWMDLRLTRAMATNKL